MTSAKLREILHTFRLVWPRFTAVLAAARNAGGVPGRSRRSSTKLRQQRRMPWSRPFDDPILPPGRRELVTLRDAGRNIAALPKAEQESPEWQAATEALIMAAEDRGAADACAHRHAAGTQSTGRADVRHVAQGSASGKA
jgi:hypothetical protein